MSPHEVTTEEAAPVHEATKQAFNWPVIALVAVALVYATLAGLRTITDYDLGWQLATGRWIVHNHQIPSTDVLSFTAQGQPWIYPALSGVLFYGVFLVGGYVLLSWLGAAACVGSVSLLLRRGSTVTAALAIVAIPLIANRTAPRADMFTVILFSAFLRLIWQHFETGSARLWLLPLLMIAWVNLHLGFIAGLALLGAYVGIEVLELLCGNQRRTQAVERLRHSLPWLLGTVVATLVNPWGWNLYFAIIRQNRAMAQHAQWIAEWASTPLNWHAISSKFSVQDTKGVFFAVLAIALLSIGLALAKRHFGIALLLAGASYMGARHIRFEALFCCVVVVVGGWLMSCAWDQFSAKWNDARMRNIVAAGAAAVFVLLALARSTDLVTDRHYLGGSSISNFGTGLSWWFPERALEFIEREKLPAQIFNDYNAGGFIAWRLGERYKDYLDGRAIPFGPEIFEHQYHLLQTDPDAPEWTREANRHNINTVVFSLARYDGNISVLPKFCASQSWKLVYIDEVSAVFLRQTSQNQPLLQRFGLDCSTFTLAPLATGAHPSQAFNYWANSMLVYNVLGRNQEAWAASNKALSLFPDNAHIHFIRASMLSNMGRLDQAEREYKAALRLEPNDVISVSLAALYRRQGRSAEADQAMQIALDLSTRPHRMLMDLAFSHVVQRQSREALAAVDEAIRRAPPEVLNSKQFQIDVFRVRAAAMDALGDVDGAIALEQKAVNLIPDCPDMWRELADLYELNGRMKEAQEARGFAAKVADTGEPAQPQKK